MTCEALENIWSWDREKLLTDTQTVQPHAALAQPLNPTVQKQYPPLQQTANTYRTPKSAEIEKNVRDATEFSLTQNDMFNTSTGIITRTRTPDFSSYSPIAYL